MSNLSGFQEMRRLLRALPIQAEKRVLQAGTNAGAREWLKALKADAPQGEKPSKMSERYGRLRKNLRMRPFRNPRPGFRGSRVHTGDAFWSIFLEFGTRNMPARPWFRQSVEAANPAAINAMILAIGRGLNREADRLAGVFKSGRK